MQYSRNGADLITIGVGVAVKKEVRVAFYESFGTFKNALQAAKN